jgi:hypothetical protein
MLQCIICRIKQASINVLCQQSTLLQKGFIKDKKLNRITLMNTHIESTHPKLVA